MMCRSFFRRISAPDCVLTRRSLRILSSCNVSSLDLLKACITLIRLLGRVLQVSEAEGGAAELAASSFSWLSVILAAPTLQSWLPIVLRGGEVAPSCKESLKTTQRN